MLFKHHEVFSCLQSHQHLEIRLVLLYIHRLAR